MNDVEKRPFQKCCYCLETKYSLTKTGFSESISDSGKLLLEINHIEVVFDIKRSSKKFSITTFNHV